MDSYCASCTHAFKISSYCFSLKNIFFELLLTIPQFLLISQTYLKIRIHFGSNASVIVKIILRANTKLCYVITRIICQINCSLQIRFYFMVNGAIKLTAIIPKNILNIVFKC